MSWINPPQRDTDMERAEEIRNNRNNLRRSKLVSRTLAVFFAVSTGLVAWVVLDQSLRFILPSLAYGDMGTQSDIHRSPLPYIEFSGRPNLRDHDYLGYRSNLECGDGGINVAFFGGSTGYNGEPQISEIVQEELQQRLGVPVVVRNFSVVSSNHRQHLHNLLETRSDCEPDLVLFYGGYNEIGQPLFYDPRPNYPFNFYFTEETHPILQWLLRASPTFNTLERVGNVTELFTLTPLHSLRKSVGYKSITWQDSLADGYLETLELAESVSYGFRGQVCGEPTLFRFAYQPFQVPREIAHAHGRIASAIKLHSAGYDLSRTLDGLDNAYTDIVHVNQQARNLIGRALSDRLTADEDLMLLLSDCAARL